MKNRLIGLGIFALIFSLNLFFSGTREAEKAAPEVFFSTSDTNQQQDQLGVSEIDFHKGILQHKTETTDFHQLVRKFPAVLGVLFLLINLHIAKGADRLFSAAYSFLPSRDLSIYYHNLRI